VSLNEIKRVFIAAARAGRMKLHDLVQRTKTDDLTSVNAVDKLESYLKKEKMLSVG
jgi:hypothetical protein